VGKEIPESSLQISLTVKELGRASILYFKVPAGPRSSGKDRLALRLMFLVPGRVNAFSPGESDCDLKSKKTLPGESDCDF